MTTLLARFILRTIFQKLHYVVSVFVFNNQQQSNNILNISYLAIVQRFVGDNQQTDHIFSNTYLTIAEGGYITIPDTSTSYENNALAISIVHSGEV